MAGFISDRMMVICMRCRLALSKISREAGLSAPNTPHARISSGPSTVHRSSTDNCPQDFRIACLFRGYSQYIPIQQHEVCLLSQSDGSNPVLLVQCSSRIAGVGVQHGLPRNTLARIEHTSGSLASFSLVDSLKDVGRGHRPVACPRDDATFVEYGARRILPLIKTGIYVWLH